MRLIKVDDSQLVMPQPSTINNHYREFFFAAAQSQQCWRKGYFFMTKESGCVNVSRGGFWQRLISVSLERDYRIPRGQMLRVRVPQVFRYAEVLLLRTQTLPARRMENGHVAEVAAAYPLILAR